MLLQTLLPALILLFGALIIAVTFVMTPNTAAEKERRIGLVAPSVAGKTSGAAVRSLEKREGPSFDRRLRQLFSLGASHRWGMKASGVRLLLTAVIAGMLVAASWLRAVALPLWAAASIGAAAALYCTAHAAT